MVKNNRQNKNKKVMIER